jgi:hypothetical protein
MIFFWSSRLRSWRELGLEMKSMAPNLSESKVVLAPSWV